MGVLRRHTDHHHLSYKDWKGNPKDMGERGANILRFFALQKNPCP